MVKLFSYGSLYDKDIQLKEFNREFYVEPHLDYVSGWDIIKVKMYGEYYKVAIPNSDSDSSPISGAIVHIPEDLISLVDEYEGLEYKKVSIKTLSGIDCIMYVKR
jgi:gamma-glutamylcyclotransferase (GGCT)/AIG2-like uncharacterized protein YtfP